MLTKALAIKDLQIKEQKLSHLPKLDLVSSLVYETTGEYEEKTYPVIGIKLTWNLFDGGVRYQERKARVMEKKSLEVKRRNLRREIQRQVLEVKREFKRKQEEAEAREKDLKQALKVVTIERRRFERGKSTLNDLLDAEDQWREQLELRNLVYLEQSMAYFKWIFVSGESFE